MEHWLWILLAALCCECKGEDKVIQTRGDVTAAEGDAVTLDCTFETSVSAGAYLFWYKQDINDFPKYMLRRDTFGSEDNAAEFQKQRFDAAINGTSVPLKIQKLHLSDSAVYYCAVKTYGSGVNKIVFGSGTKLHVNDNEEYDPSYYEVTDNEATHACLATGFSRHNATKKHPSISGIFEKQPAVRISDDSLYNQVAILSSVNDTCVPDGMEKGECTDGLTPDPKVNLVTMTILGLRLLFIKTVVFNVLITLRLWISQ